MILRQPYFLHKRIFSDEELTKISSIGEALEPQQAKTFNGNARKNYRDSHISWIENTAHFPMLESPEKWLQSILKA